MHTRLFHIHFHVPDIGYAERVLADKGLPLRAKFGSINDEMVALEPGEAPPEDFHFRLQDSQRGYANITLTPGKSVRFDHFGLVTTEFDSIIQRANDADWHVQGVDEPRTFLITPWGFRVEIHAEDGRVVDSLGSWDECRFEEVVLTLPDRQEAEEGIKAVIGHIPGFRVREAKGRPHIRQISLGGQAFLGEPTLRAASLATEQRPDADEENV